MRWSLGNASRPTRYLSLSFFRWPCPTVEDAEKNSVMRERRLSAVCLPDRLVDIRPSDNSRAGLPHKWQSKARQPRPNSKPSPERTIRHQQPSSVDNWFEIRSADLSSLFVRPWKWLRPGHPAKRNAEHCSSYVHRGVVWSDRVLDKERATERERALPVWIRLLVG